ncbi:MAG: RND family transporter [Balneolaceae bacterium]
MEKFGLYILSRPGTMISLVVLVALAAVYPAMQIRTDFNLEGFYPKNDLVIKDYQILEEEFGRDDNTILIGVSDPNLISVPVLLNLRSITDSLQTIPHINSVRSLWSATEIRSSGADLTFDEYLTESRLNADSLKQIRERLADDPFLRGVFISDDFKSTSIVIEIKENENTYPNRNVIISEINRILNQFNTGNEFHISGIPYFRNQYVNMLNEEIVVYIAISSFLIISLLLYLYRSLWGVLFPMIIVWITLLLTIAVMYLTGGHLEIMSSTIAPILLCVGVADAIHMISKYDDNREHGIPKRRSIIEMLKTLGSATFLTSLTTAIGFATLISSSVVPMQRFGIYTAAGVLIAYLITIIFLPAALSKSKKKKVFNENGSALYKKLYDVLLKVSALNRKYYKRIVTGTLLLTAGFGFGIFYLNVDGQIFDDIDEETEIMRDSRFFSENLSPQFPMEFIINSGYADGVLNASLLNRLSDFEHFLVEFPEIHKVIGFHTLISQVHQTMRPDLDEYLPADDDAIAQYSLLLEINGGDEINRFVNFDFSTLRVTAFVEDAGSGRINEIRDDINLWLNDKFPDETFTITGTTILSADLTEKIVYSLAWSIILAIIAISFIMALLFRNFRLVIISLIPNLLPLVVIGGVMGYMGIAIKPSTAVIFTISLGIAIDDSIHYLARFRIEYLRRKTMFPALSVTTVKTGRAIIITSLILIAGFGSLISSSFTSTAMMGLLVCITIGAALIADLLLLPSLFYWLKPNLKIGKNGKQDLQPVRNESPKSVLEHLTG